MLCIRQNVKKNTHQSQLLSTWKHLHEESPDTLGIETHKLVVTFIDEWNLTFCQFFRFIQFFELFLARETVGEYDSFLNLIVLKAGYHGWTFFRFRLERTLCASLIGIIRVITVIYYYNYLTFLCVCTWWWIWWWTLS